MIVPIFLSPAPKSKCHEQATGFFGAEKKAD
jgi:hypothetical protein